jgi:hypothetical protein
MKKKASGKAASTKSDPNLVPQPQGRIVEAGGGPGHNNLEFDQLRKGQEDMFQRSINVLPPLLQLNREQEARQTELVESSITINVTVAREDYLDVEAPISITFFVRSGQAAWRLFTQQVQEKLRISFLECVLDRSDGAQVHTILSLRDGGYYLARQRESSAILDTISTGKNPTQVWVNYE